MEADILNKSEKYIQEGKFEKAQIILRRVLKDNPSHSRALELSGDLSLKLGRNSDAIQRYDHASSNYTNNNQYFGAIICLEKIVKIDQLNDEIYSRLADMYRFYGLPNRAVNTILDLCTLAIDNKNDSVFLSGLRKIVELQPKNLGLRLSFCKALLAIERKQEAQDELKKLRALAEETQDKAMLEEVNKLLPQPDGGEELDPKSRIELGNLLYEIGSKDEAIIEFQKAVSDLIENNETEDALNVLNRIVEIDPNNTEAIDKIKELKGETVIEAPEEIAKTGEVKETSSEVEMAEPEIPEEAPSETVEEAVEEVAPEPEVEETPTEKKADAAIEAAPSEAEEIAPSKAAPSEAEQGIEMFQDLGQEIEGFVPASESGTAEDSTSTESEVESGQVQSDEISQLEGQIADIEFLLKEAETPTTPSFEIAKVFDDFRNSISWQHEDEKKILDLAKRAFETGLYEAALNYVADIKGDKQTWPLSLEINGGSLVKLGRYSNAIKSIAPTLLLEEIPEAKKIELRYLLASAYEGLGDFENALREIERIISIDPNYKDVREMYALLGGKEVFPEEPQGIVEEKPTVTEQVSPPIEPLPQPIEKTPSEIIEEPLKPEIYPTIVEEAAQIRPEKIPEKSKEKLPEEEIQKGENIAFL